jgi:tetraacyldisaccharide 4'-kinase
VSDGSKVFSNPANAGDEPYLLACNLVGIAAVISDANRFAAGEGAIKHLATNCFVLTMVLQHLQLARELDIVLSMRRIRLVAGNFYLMAVYAKTSAGSNAQTVLF